MYGLGLFQTYLPQRYKAESAHIVDSEGQFSEQIDVVVFDRQYSPFIFKYLGQTIIPSESVYAVFESKQTISKREVIYAKKKVASVRKLRRTSIPIPHAGGVYPPKPLPHIFGGLLTFDSEWKPPLGEPLLNSLRQGTQTGRLDIGCVAAHGIFAIEGDENYVVKPKEKPATSFLLELIARFTNKRHCADDRYSCLCKMASGLMDKLTLWS